MVLNDRIADGRDVSWIWDADFETLAPHAARVVCSGTRAEELALRLKYAGIAPDALEVVPRLERGLDRALAARTAGRPLYALPTYTALLELRDVLADARPRAALLGMTHGDLAAIWHDVECGSYDADLGLWEELVGRGRRRCSTSAAAPAGWRCTSRGAGAR